MFGDSDAAILKALGRLKISRKKITLYREMNEGSRQKYVEKLIGIPPEILVSVDQTGVDQCLYGEYARAARGQNIISKISGRIFRRTNIAAGIRQGQWIAPMEYTGTTV